MLPYVFISYSHEDVEFAQQLENDLTAHHVDVWRDENYIPLGSDWDNVIEDALSSESITHVLVILSPEAVKSTNVKNEIEYAREHKKIIIPVYHKSCKRPLNIIRKNYIDFRTDYDLSFQKLVNALKTSTSTLTNPLTKISSHASVSQLTQQQYAAAQDPSTIIRLIAAPGTGKSLVIEERVRWLLAHNVNPQCIAVVSFTRASTRDLQERIFNYCEKHNQHNVYEINISTLHSLALKALRKSNIITNQPQVLDDWEQKNIFDAEFSQSKRNTSIGLEKLTPGRAEIVRKAWEAYWSNGSWTSLQSAEQPTEIEKEAFTEFHKPTATVYSCVLPGELVKLCVDNIKVGLFNPAEILGIQHLIVDEFQDLNFVDQQFIDSFISHIVTTFIAGDDDQSIYSFRYARPAGIQEFVEKYSGVSNHYLEECFRCSPRILQSANSLIVNYSTPKRIKKHTFSFCNDLKPDLSGFVKGWIFKSEIVEYTAIAETCRDLISSQYVKARDILILISNRHALLNGNPPLLKKLFDDRGVPLELPSVGKYIDTECGRFVYALLRAACDSELNNYVAVRTIMQFLNQVAIPTIDSIRNRVIEHHLNYMELFLSDEYDHNFPKRERNALIRVREILAHVHTWDKADTLDQRLSELTTLISEYFGQDEQNLWQQQIGHLPKKTRLEDLLAYISADHSEVQEGILQGIYEREGWEIPANGILPQQVRIMTMHGAKGLNANIVFIPGLEQDVLPGPKREDNAGLILESARQLYVSLTRARIATIISFAKSRMIDGTREFNRQHSVFLPPVFKDIDITMHNREKGLSKAECNEIYESIKLYNEHQQKRQKQISSASVDAQN